MKPIDFETLRKAIEQPRPASRDILFSALASERAAWRARAADALVSLYSVEGSNPRPIGRQFGASVDAIFTPVLDDLRARIGMPRSDHWPAFLASTEMDYDTWRDGVGFDLDALGRMPPAEQNLVRQWLHTKLRDRQRDIDFRELEAAAALQENELLTSLRRHPDANVRLRVKELLKQPDDVEAELCRTLSRSRSEDDVLRALDLVPGHATAKVRDALIQRVKKVDETFINAAMVLLEAFCGVTDAWPERPFLFKVQSEGARGPSLAELLARARHDGA